MNEFNALSTPEQMQRIVHLQYHYVHGLGGIVTFYAEERKDKKGAKKILWFKEKSGGLLLSNVQVIIEAVIPIMKQITGHEFLLEGSMDDNPIHWIRKDYLDKS